MTETLSLPLWLVLVFGLLAVWAMLDLLLMPSVRWVLRRGAKRIIDELNVRLRIEIQPFQRTRRQVLLDRLLYDPKVQDAAEAHARAHEMPREVVMSTVRRFAHEIVPAFNAYVYFRFATGWRAASPGCSTGCVWPMPTRPVWPLSRVALPRCS